MCEQSKEGLLIDGRRMELERGGERRTGHFTFGLSGSGVDCMSMIFNCRHFFVFFRITYISKQSFQQTASENANEFNYFSLHHQSIHRQAPDESLLGWL